MLDFKFEDFELESIDSSPIHEPWCKRTVQTTNQHLIDYPVYTTDQRWVHLADSRT